MTMLRALLRSITIAFAVLAAAAGAAGAYTLEANPAGEVAWTSLGKLTYESSGISTACNFTLGGALEAGPTALTEGAALGEVTAVEWANCEAGSISGVLGLPWPLRFDSASGTLPNEVTGFGLRIEGFSWRLAVWGGFVNCLYRGDLSVSMAVTGENPYESGLSGLSGTLTKISGSLCPASMSITGTLALEPEQTLTVE